MFKQLLCKHAFAIRLLGVFISGSLLAAATELPYSGWIIIPILSLVWLQLDCRQFATLKKLFSAGLVFGIGYFATALWWLYISLHDVGGMNSILSCVAVFLLSAYVSLYFAGATLALGLFKNQRLKGLFLASSWVLIEYLRGEIFTGFPWMGLAESQVNGPFAMIAPIFGGLGCTFLTVYVSWQILKLRISFVPSFISIALVGLVAILSNQWSFTHAVGKPISVELLQGNFSQSLIFRPEGIQKQINFYQQAMLQSKTELTLAPETAFPWPESNLPKELIQNLQEHSDETGGNLLFGIVGSNPNDADGREYSNRAIGLAPQSLPYRYDKDHLVPFGEFIPPGFRWFVDAFSVPLSDFSRGGNQQANFTIVRKDQKTLNAAITICYEDVFGGELASRIRNNHQPTNLLINLTNLAWFGRSQAPTQQLRLSQLRSLETGLPALRATNTGITAVLGPDGKVLKFAPEFTQTSLNAVVQAYDGITPYVAWGNFPILTISCLLLIWGFISQRRS